jgi:PAS domain S-box-containing protein
MIGAESNSSNTPEAFNLELFFELSPDLICIAGYDGYFKRINPTVVKILGYTPKELFARPINDFVHPDDKEITASNRANLRKGVPLLNFENRYLTKSGETVWLSWTSMPVDSAKVVFAIAKVITHRRKLDEERNELLANFTRINNELKQLTYTTSHDLRTPVNNLLAIFGLLDVSKINDEETLLCIDMLKASTENLKTTLNTYVDVLNRKESLHVAVEELDLQQCLDETMLSLSSLIQSSKTVMHVDFSAVKKALFNRAYLESILLNLITNSIKYAKPDTYPVIYISSQRVNGITQLIFADEGLGFDMDKVKDRIFGFNQTFHHHHDSKGIGLYLVYNHVISLDGKISVESKVNEGVKFTISLNRNSIPTVQKRLKCYICSKLNT